MSCKKIIKNLQVIFLIVIFMASTTGCTNRVLISMDRDFPEESLVYVKLKSGQEIKVKGPRLDGGVLTGLTPLADTLPGFETEIRINVYEIKSISVERIEYKKSIVVLATIAGSIIIVFYLVGRAYCCWGES